MQNIYTLPSKVIINLNKGIVTLRVSSAELLHSKSRFSHPKLARASLILAQIRAVFRYGIINSLAQGSSKSTFIQAR